MPLSTNFTHRWNTEVTFVVKVHNDMYCICCYKHTSSIAEMKACTNYECTKWLKNNKNDTVTINRETVQDPSTATFIQRNDGNLSLSGQYIYARNYSLILWSLNCFYSYSVNTDDLHWVQSTRKHMVTQLVLQAQLPLIQNAQTGNFIFKIRLGCLSDLALCLGTVSILGTASISWFMVKWLSGLSKYVHNTDIFDWQFVKSLSA